MAEPTPERQHLRERLREVAKDAFASEKRPDGVRLLSDIRNPWRALEDAVDAVLAELAADPGDLPKRMADALGRVVYIHPELRGEVVEAILSVRDGATAHVVARLAEAEEQRDRYAEATGNWSREALEQRERAEVAEAQVAALQREIADLKAAHAANK